MRCGWEPDSFLTADPDRGIRNIEILRAADEQRYEELDYLAHRTGEKVAEAVAGLFVAAGLITKKQG